MDLACFEVLERRIKALAKSFEQTQAENQQLRQQVHRLQQSVTAQQRALEQVQCERDDLMQVNAALNVLRQEREVTQQKLRYMLETIEWLEKHTAISGESHAG